MKKIPLPNDPRRPKRGWLMFCLLLILIGCASCTWQAQGRIPDESGGRIEVPPFSEQPAESSSAPDLPTEPPETGAPPEPVITRLSFLGVGDNIVYYGNVRDAMAQAVEGGRKYNFKPAYSSLADRIQNADIAFINQENVMTGGELSYYPHFNCPQEVALDLIETGFDVINMANNHMLDQGASGLKTTIDYWNTLDVMMIGGYLDREDFDNIRIYEKSGIRIAFLSFAEMTNGLSLPASSSLFVPYLKEEDVTRQVTEAKKISDLVFVSVHWGDENVFAPSSVQTRYAQLMADLGADVILGHHPHVIQKVEWLTGKDGNQTLCVYSLGNFMAEMAHDINMVGGMIEFDIVREDDAKPTIENVLFTPTMFHFPRNFYNNHIYLLEDYTEELARTHGVITYYQNSLSYDRLLSYVKNTVSPVFLPAFYQ